MPKISHNEAIHSHITQAKAIFFDHDDTLVGTKEPKWRHHKHVAKTFYNKDLGDEELAMHWGKPLHELVCLLYGTDDATQAMKRNQSCHEDFPKTTFTRTTPTLRALKKLGKTLGIVTATSRFSFEHDLIFHKLPKDILDYTQTAEDSAYHKPDGRVFEPAHAWLDTRNIAPHEVLYIGDALRDMQAAVDAGFKFLGVETGVITAAQFKQAGTPSIPTIGDLIST